MNYKYPNLGSTVIYGFFVFLAMLVAYVVTH